MGVFLGIGVYGACFVYGTAGLAAVGVGGLTAVGGGSVAVGAGTAVSNPQIMQTGVQGLWNLDKFVRGGIIERFLNQNLPQNFPVIDIFDDVTGAATSIKSLNLSSPTYQSMSNITSLLNKYIRALNNFNGLQGIWAGANVPVGSITTKTMQLAIPPGATPAQMQAIQRSINYAQQRGINFITTVVQ